MPLKRRYHSQDEVPEALREHYKEVEGRFEIDIEGMVHRERLEEFRDSNIELNNKVKKLETNLEAFKDLDPEKARDALKKVQELGDKKLFDDGKVEELVAERLSRLKTDYEAQIDALGKAKQTLEGENGKIKERLNKELIDNAVTAAATKAGVRQAALTDVALRARGVWKLDENGNPVAYNGERPIYGKDATKHLTMDEYMEGLAKEAPHLFEENKGGGASGSDRRGTEHGRMRAGDPNLSRSLADIASGKITVED